MIHSIIAFCFASLTFFLEQKVLYLLFATYYVIIISGESLGLGLWTDNLRYKQNT